jgi:cytochrome c oxidase assembly protein subunit 15
MTNDRQSDMSHDELRRTQPYSPWPHRVAITLCCVTFPLIWVGGLVTTYDAGMAVPDWPTTFGYNLFAYPWKTWLFGPFDLFIEHGHRLLGATVGFIAIGLLITVFRCDRRPWMRYAAIAMLAFVVVQGVLGGVRVRLDERSVAMIHACFGLASFAFSAAMATFTSRSWHDGVRTFSAKQLGDTRLFRIAVLVAGITYIQVVLGALLRHIPVVAAPGVFRAAVWLHIIFGMAVVAHVVMLAIRLRPSRNDLPTIRRRVHVLSLLVMIQVALGASTWVLKYGWPAWFADQSFAAGFVIQANSMLQALITTLHVAVGALILSLSVVIAIRLARFQHFAAEVQRAPMKPIQATARDIRNLNGERAAIALAAARSPLGNSCVDFVS